MDERPDPQEVAYEQGYADWLQQVIEHTIRRLNDQVAREEDPLKRTALHRVHRRRIRQLEDTRDELVKGRVDLESGEVHYFGKVLLEHPDRPAEYPLINWESPYWATCFTDASRAEPGGVGRRRTIRMRGRTVVDLSDEYLIDGFKPEAPNFEEIAPPTTPSLGAGWSEPSGRSDRQADDGDAETQPEPELIGSGSGDGATLVPATTPEPPATAPYVRASDLLLRELEESRTGAMREVVATIQGDQDRVIRSELDRSLIIQGGPGTGKTVVALHRAAWVMYEQERSGMFGSPTGLVVGPNRVFMEYIKGVLPSLGRAEVTRRALVDLARSGLSGDDQARTEPVRVATPAEAQIKGDPRMADVVAQAVWRHAQPDGLEFPYRRFILRVDRAEVLGMLRRLFEQRTPYAESRSALRGLIVRAFTDQVARRGELVASSTTERNALDRALGAHLSSLRWMDRVLPKVNPRRVLLKLFSDEEYRSACTINLTPKARSSLAAERGSRAYQWSFVDMALLDEASYVIRGAPQAFTHVVVDEAQDLSPMEWRVIRRRAGGALTITGDLGQATSQWGATSWDDVVDRAGIEDRPLYSELRLGYRVPEEVMLFAGQLLAEAAPQVDLPRSFRDVGGSVTVKRTTKQRVRVVITDRVGELRQGGGRVAVIAPAADVERVGTAFAGDESVVVLTPDECKGLEFDHVVAIEPKSIAEADDVRLGLRRLFVCLTRSTLSLTVVHTRQLPPQLAQLHPTRVSRRQALRLKRLELLQEGGSKRDAERAIWSMSGRRWTPDEDEDLRREVGSGLTLELVAELHKRKPGAISARCRRLGIRVPPSERLFTG